MGSPPFSPQELIFLEKYLIEKEGVVSAMKAVGYGGYTDRHLFNLAKKIVIRYDSRAGDARKVFRQAGVGGVRLAQKVDKLLDAASERTQLGAAELAAKVLRATQEPGTVDAGVRINININIMAPGQVTVAPGPPGAPPGGPPPPPGGEEVARSEAAPKLGPPLLLKPLDPKMGVGIG
jgi:hypothetical protein